MKQKYRMRLVWGKEINKIVETRENESEKKAESENDHCFKMTVSYEYFLKSCVNIKMYAPKCEITNQK